MQKKETPTPAPPAPVKSTKAYEILFDPINIDPREYVIRRVHTTGIPVTDVPKSHILTFSDGTKRYPLHWSVTFECRKKIIAEEAPKPAAQSQPSPQDLAKSLGRMTLGRSTTGSGSGVSRAPSSRAPSSTTSTLRARATTSQTTNTNTNTNTITTYSPELYYFRVDSQVHPKDYDQSDLAPDSIVIQITITKKRYPHSNKAPLSAKTTLRVRPTKNYPEFRLHDFLLLIKANRRQYYRPDSKGNGCCFFMQTLVRDIGSTNVVDTNSNEYKKIMAIRHGVVVDDERYYIAGGVGTFFRSLEKDEVKER